MDTKVTIVSVIIIDENHTFGRAASYVASEETLEECIASVKVDAFEDFNNESGSAVHRVVVSVTTIPMPSAANMPHVEVTGATEDKAGAPVTVTTEIS